MNTLGGPNPVDDAIVVRAGGPLDGEIDVPGAKNSVLKLMASTLLCDGDYHLTNVPEIVDVGIMADLLQAIGVETVATAPGELTMTNTGSITSAGCAQAWACSSLSILTCDSRCAKRRSTKTTMAKMISALDIKSRKFFL